jgi:hypothetical protein
MPELRQAAGFEGLIVIAVIYFFLSTIARTGRKSSPGKGSPRPGGPVPGEPQGESFSLEAVLREIQRVKQEKEGARRPLPARRTEPPPPLPPREGRMGAAARTVGDRTRALPMGRMAQSAQTERGPLGRHSRIGLPSAEEVEDRTSLEEQRSAPKPVRLEILDATRERAVVDQDEGAEALVERRIQEAEARNVAISAADHVKFDRAIRETAAPAAATRRYPIDQLRQALIWREILGPPRSMQ